MKHLQDIRSSGKTFCKNPIGPVLPDTFSFMYAADWVKRDDCCEDCKSGYDIWEADVPELTKERYTTRLKSPHMEAHVVLHGNGTFMCKTPVADSLLWVPGMREGSVEVSVGNTEYSVCSDCLYPAGIVEPEDVETLEGREGVLHWFIHEDEPMVCGEPPAGEYLQVQGMQDFLEVDFPNITHCEGCMKMANMTTRESGKAEGTIWEIYHLQSPRGSGEDLCGHPISRETSLPYLFAPLFHAHFEKKRCESCAAAAKVTPEKSSVGSDELVHYWPPLDLAKNRYQLPCGGQLPSPEKLGFPEADVSLWEKDHSVFMAAKAQGYYTMSLAAVASRTVMDYLDPEDLPEDYLTIVPLTEEEKARKFELCPTCVGIVGDPYVGQSDPQPLAYPEKPEKPEAPRSVEEERAELLRQADAAQDALEGQLDSLFEEAEDALEGQLDSLFEEAEGVEAPSSGALDTFMSTLKGLKDRVLPFHDKGDEDPEDLRVVKISVPISIPDVEDTEELIRKYTSGFMRYFTDIMEYPSVLSQDLILPWGILYNFVGHDFLDAFVNQGKILKAFVLNCYYLMDEVIDEEDGVTKEEYVDKALATRGNKSLSAFEDDVVLLLEIPVDRKSTLISPARRYAYLHYDGDTSDCSIGRFKTLAEQDRVLELFQEHHQDDVAVEIPLEYFKHCSVRY